MNSMRRRQTVLGEQLQAAAAAPNPPSQSLLVPGQSQQASMTGMNGAPRSGHHMRSFSRLSTRQANHSNEDVSMDTASLASVTATGDDEIDAALLSPGLDPMTYLRGALSGADASDIVQFGERLRAQAQRANESEHRHLQSNHKALSTVAASVAKLGPAVSELHSQVADLAAVSDAMVQDAYAAKSYGNPRRLSASSDVENASEDEVDEVAALPVDRRQSMLILNSAWAHDLQGLYRRVKGAQKVLPPSPGRHLVHEETEFQELNLVTQQPVKPVLLVVLNDHLLVAASRHGQFVLEAHYALDGDLRVDIDEETRSLRVGRANAMRGYLSPSLGRLRSLYGELCKLIELATSTSRAVARRRQASRRSTRSGNRLSQRHARNLSSSSHHSANELSLQTRREAAMFAADFDREVAYRRWPTAVALYLEHRHSEHVEEAFAERGEKLSETLLDELKTLRPRTKSETAELIRLLVSLDRANEARTAFLATAALDIEVQTRDVHFMGDVVTYISQMAAIYFQTIIATVEVYRMAFDKPEDSSVVVAWAKSQVDLYAGIFNRQLFRIAPQLKGYQRCREVSRLESSQLRDLKMDMEFMLRYVWES